MEKQQENKQTKSVSAKRSNPLSFADRRTIWGLIIILLVKIFAKCVSIIKNIVGINKVAFFNFLKNYY